MIPTLIRPSKQLLCNGGIARRTAAYRRMLKSPFGLAHKLDLGPLQDFRGDQRPEPLEEIEQREAKPHEAKPQEAKPQEVETQTQTGCQSMQEWAELCTRVAQATDSTSPALVLFDAARLIKISEQFRQEVITQTDAEKQDLHERVAVALGKAGKDQLPGTLKAHMVPSVLEVLGYSLRSCPAVKTQLDAIYRRGEKTVTFIWLRGLLIVHTAAVAGEIRPQAALDAGTSRSRGTGS